MWLSYLTYWKIDTLFITPFISFQTRPRVSHSKMNPIRLKRENHYIARLTTEVSLVKVLRDENAIGTPDPVFIL